MSMQYIDIYKIECTVLSTFLSTPEELGYNIEPFKMESKYFTNDFNKIVCERIMKELATNGCMILLETKLIGWCRDIKTQYQPLMMNIITCGALPMSIANKYYEEMKVQYMERLANGR